MVFFWLPVPILEIKEMLMLLLIEKLFRQRSLKRAYKTCVTEAVNLTSVH